MANKKNLKTQAETSNESLGQAYLTVEYPAGFEIEFKCLRYAKVFHSSCIYK